MSAYKVSTLAAGYLFKLSWSDFHTSWDLSLGVKWSRRRCSYHELMPVDEVQVTGGPAHQPEGLSGTRHVRRCGWRHDKENGVKQLLFTTTTKTATLWANMLVSLVRFRSDLHSSTHTSFSFGKRLSLIATVRRQ